MERLHYYGDDPNVTDSTKDDVKQKCATPNGAPHKERARLIRVYTFDALDVTCQGTDCLSYIDPTNVSCCLRLTPITDRYCTSATVRYALC